MAWILGRVRTEATPLIHDPLSHRNPSKVLLSKEYQRSVAEILRESKPIIDLTGDLKLKTSKAALSAGGLKPKEEETANSCHNVVRDPEGNWVTMMHTGQGGGASGIVVDGVWMHGGVNNAVCVGPGRRLRIIICPIMIIEDGEPWMALGTPGAVTRALPIVLTNIFEFGMEPYTAIDAPRFEGLQEEMKMGVMHSVGVENRISKEAVTGLAKLGVLVNPLGNYDDKMGSVQIVWKDKKTGLLKGCSDPRRLGYAEGI